MQIEKSRLAKHFPSFAQQYTHLCCMQEVPPPPTFYHSQPQQSAGCVRSCVLSQVNKRSDGRQLHKGSGAALTEIAREVGERGGRGFASGGPHDCIHDRTAQGERHSVADLDQRLSCVTLQHAMHQDPELFWNFIIA